MKEAGVHTQILLGFSIDYLVKFLIKLLQLCSLRHGFFVHQLRSLQRCVALLSREEVESILDQGLIQEYTRALQEISPVSSNLGSSFLVIPIKSLKNLVMWKEIEIPGLLYICISRPFSNDWIFFLKCVSNFQTFTY